MRCGNKQITLDMALFAGDLFGVNEVPDYEAQALEINASANGSNPSSRTII